MTTYNLDEYYPISPLDPEELPGLHAPAPVRPGGHRPATAPTCSTARCPRRSSPSTPREFDRWIEADGGLDLQLLGIGRNGHIGFNEPSDLTVAEALRLPTRLVELHPVTRGPTPPGSSARVERSSPGP